MTAERYRQLLGVIEGMRGWLELDFQAAIRFDYGEVKPWLKRRGVGVYAAIGGNDGLLVVSDVDLERVDQHDIGATVAVRAGQRLHFSLQYLPAEELDQARVATPDPADLDARLEETLAWWRRWAGRIRLDSPDAPAVKRSAIVLKGLRNAPHRGDRRRPHDQPPREPRRRPQLGLPLQLGAGLGLHRAVPGRRRRGRRVPAVHRTQRRRLRRGRGAPGDRPGPVPRGVRQPGPGAGRQLPQGLSHLSHIAAAVALAQPYGPGSAVAQHAFGAGQHEGHIEERS